MATAPKPGTTRTGDDSTLVVELDGQKWLLRIGDASAADVAELRRSTGYSLAGLLDGLQSSTVDVDQVATLIWFARRVSGDPVDYDQHMRGFGYGDAARLTITAEADTTDEDGTSPEV